MDLDEGLAEFTARGMALPAAARERLDGYLTLLDKWNRTYNLTAVRERERMVTHHILDSLAVLPLMESVDRLLDIGSGAGLPGIPLGIARPDWAITLVDSSHKKGTFMQHVVGTLGLPNVAVRVSRIEDLHPPPDYGAIVSRAFSDLATFAHAALPLLASGGRMYAMKGMAPHEELADLPPTVRVVANQPIDVPGLDAQRHVVIMERV